MAILTKPDLPEQARFLREKRMSLYLKQQKVADRAGISKRRYQCYEYGERELTKAPFLTALHILEALEIDPADFCHRFGPLNDPAANNK